jgi:hypothetical protein
MTSANKATTATEQAVPSSQADTMTAQTEQAIGVAKASFELIATKSREAMEQSLKSVTAITEMTRGNVDALIESSRVASGGMQAIAQDVAEYSKHTLERTATAAKALSQAKTAPELMQLQSEFAQAEFNNAITEMTKLSQDMFKTMTAIFEPLQARAMAAAQIKDLLKD